MNPEAPSRMTTPPPAAGAGADTPAADLAGDVAYSLLADGRLGLVLEPDLIPFIEKWLPRIPLDPDPVSASGEDGALIQIARAGEGDEDPPPYPTATPTLRLGSATIWVDPVEERVLLRGSERRVHGIVDLRSRRARLTPPPTGDETIIAANLYSMMTVVAALLLGRLGRTPIHAGAIIRPGGGALLLAGDARAGKSTTCMNLISSGWDYLSDDQVVLSRTEGSDAVSAEGWPRVFHLDEGWEHGVSTGVRRDVDPGEIGPGCWRRFAEVEGLLFPIVRADQPTALTPIPASDALARLIRQTPWLLVDQQRGPALLALLSSLAAAPAHELSLGLDTYRDPERLARVIGRR